MHPFSASLDKKRDSKVAWEDEKGEESIDVAPPHYVEHLGKQRAYMRDFILGINDGLVSMFLLILGVSGGGLSTSQILLTGITGAAAGIVSMAAGEFLATKSQNDVTVGELALEHVHFKYFRNIEIDQVRTGLRECGIEGQLLEDATAQIASKDETLMNWMKKTEFGVSENDRRTPLRAAAVSGALYFIGSLPSVIPYACTTTVRTAMIAAGVAAGTSMFLVGAFKGYATRSSMLRGALENTAVGALGSAICYAIGYGYDYAR